MLTGILTASSLLWSHLAQTHVVHVTGVTLDLDDENFRLQFQVVNPFPRRISVNLEPGVVACGHVGKLLAATSLVVELEPGEDRRLTVLLKRPLLTQLRLREVMNLQPQVLILDVEMNTDA